MNQRSVIWNGLSGKNAIKSGGVLKLFVQKWDVLDTDLTVEIFERDAGESGKGQDDAIGSFTGQIKRWTWGGVPRYGFEIGPEGLEASDLELSYASFTLVVFGDRWAPQVLGTIKIGGEFESERGGDQEDATCEYEVGIRIKQGDQVLEPGSDETPIVARVEQHMNDEEVIKRFHPWTPQFPCRAFTYPRRGGHDYPAFQTIPRTPLGFLPTAEDFHKLGCGHICATILLRYWGELNDPSKFIERAGLRDDRCWKLTALTRTQKRDKTAKNIPELMEAPAGTSQADYAQQESLYCSLPYKSLEVPPNSRVRTRGRRWTWDDMHAFEQWTKAEILALDRRERDPLLWAWWWRQVYVFSHLGQSNINMKPEVLLGWLQRAPSAPWDDDAGETFGGTEEYSASGRAGWYKTLSWLSQEPPVPVVFKVSRPGGAHYMIAIGAEPGPDGAACLLVHDSGGWIAPGKHITPVQTLREAWRYRYLPTHVAKMSYASWNRRAVRCYPVKRKAGWRTTEERTDWTLPQQGPTGG